MIKFSGQTMLNDVIIKNGGATAPAVTTEWPASQPLLFNQTQTTDNLWGVANFIGPLGLLHQGGNTYAEFTVNPISNPGETVPLSKAYTFVGDPLVFEDNGGTVDYIDGILKFDGQMVGAEGSWNYPPSDPTAHFVSYEGQVSYPAGIPDTAHGLRKKLGDVRNILLTLKNDKPSYSALYFTPDENMPQGKTFIDNWGPLGFLKIAIGTYNTGNGLYGQMNGTQPVNALAGIIKRSAVGTLPSVIAFSDIVCGVLIRNNDAIFIQNGVELYRTNTTANPGPGNNPGGFVECEITPAFWYTAPNATIYYGYDGIAQAINTAVAPNGLSDFTNTVRINDSFAYVPKKNGTHNYTITAGGNIKTLTMTYNATTDFVSSTTSSSGTAASSQNYEGSGLALVCHNETNLVGMTDLNNSQPILMNMRIDLKTEFDREGVQTRSF